MGKRSKEETREAVRKYKAAKKALDENAEREIKAGIVWETNEYYRLNDAVNDAIKDVPWWRR